MSKEKGTGINRWLIVGLIVLAGLVSGWIAPIKPHVQLPGEDLTAPLFHVFGQPFTLTNSLLTTFIIYLLLIWLAFSVRRGLSKDGGRTPWRSRGDRAHCRSAVWTGRIHCRKPVGEALLTLGGDDHLPGVVCQYD
jgi:hypothetical protein